MSKKQTIHDSHGNPLVPRAAAGRLPGGPGGLGPIDGGVAFRGSGRREVPQGLSFQLVLHAIRQWWMVALPVAIILVTAGVAVVLATFRPQYRASAWLRIHETAPSLVFEPRDSHSQVFVQTQIELLRSPVVLAPVVNDPAIAALEEFRRRESRVEWMAKQLQLRPVGQSELLTVSYASSSPRGAASVVNAVVQSFFVVRSEDDARRTDRIIQLLEKEKAHRELEVGRRKDAYRSAAIAATGHDPFAVGTDEKNAAPVHPLGSLQMRLVTAEVEREVAEAKRQAFEETMDLGVVVPETRVQQMLAANTQLLEAAQMIDQKRMVLAEAQKRAVHPERDPFCSRLAAEIPQDEASLRQLRSELEVRIRDDLKETFLAERKDQMQQLRQEAEVQRIAEASLRAKYAEFVAQSQESRQAVMADTVNLDIIQSELVQAQAVLEQITSRILQLRTEQQAPARVNLLSPAEEPQTPIERYPLKYLAVVVLAGFAVPFGVAVVWERLLHRISDVRSVEQQTRLPVLGEVPRLPTRSVHPGVLGARRTGSTLRMFEESIDSMRTCLVLSEQLEGMQTIAVTSAASSEGKTSVASQLAVSLAQASGQATLLIDGDLRSPDVHRVFGIPQSPGLAEVLAGETSLDEAIITRGGQNVHLLLAGKIHMSPHKALGNGTVRELIAGLLPRYRYIVIDTPPILAAGESLLLAKAADATLLCTMRDVSRAGQVKKACERLTNAGCRTVGAVLSGVPGGEYRYRYGSYEYMRGR